ncbi:hypothetical protein Poli38472_004960 [Pythium oligandrum]|uniref:Uncharacterized protein n=1 Tax=Pythium oligandrum TaxID=41045 RepID=A0A8K1CBG7_PYTOL|nr:hypothetical protein Poli38472_004960 [Pythium oligandrum]|eukprot:TMW59891.1 hypothetical protein Poli38472_004960 [Pythium oligandrum]
MDEEDDSDTLREALALIDALESDDGPLLTGASSADLCHADSIQVASNSKPVKRQNAASKSGLLRDKEEIQALRQQLKELQHKLETLQALEMDGKGPLITTRRLASMYKAMAKRQRRSLQRAEVDNARRRQQVDIQLRATHNCLTNGQSNTLPQTLRSVPTQAIVSDTSTQPARSIRLEDLYRYTDAAFSASCFSDGSENFRFTQVLDENEMTKIVEIYDGWVVPFSADVTDRALWHFLSERSYWEESAYDLRFEKNGDSATAEYRATAGVGRLLLGGYQDTYSMQRFPSSTTAPSIIISSFIADSIETSEQTPSVSVYELAWLRVQDMRVIVKGEETWFARVHSSCRTRIDGGALPPSGRQTKLEAVTT